MKNTTRIGSLMGTWTGQSHLKAKVGPYSVTAYFVLNLVPDPMRYYGCVMEHCSEFYNQACRETDDRKNWTQECISLNNNTLEWSDVSAFFYFGVRVDVGVPFNKHVVQDSGSWVGPLNMILAQAPLDHVDDPSRNSTMAAKLVDRYVVRYVETPTTTFLHMPPNCSLVSPDDFTNNLGPQAVRHSVSLQNGTSASGIMKNVTAHDPYREYLETCDNGDVQPILPALEFRFLKDETSDKERVGVQLNYKVLTMPHKKDPIYKLYPFLQSRLNQRGMRELHISGPYCYGDDPQRGYTFDLSYDSLQESDYMQLVHGCVEGVPACLPPPAELMQGGGSSDMITIHTTGSVGGDIMWMLASFVLLVALFSSVFCNYRQWQRSTSQSPISGNDLRHALVASDRTNEESLSQPLLEQEQLAPEGEVTENERRVNEPVGTEEAKVAFV